jgi:hypothetical protein
MMAGASAMMLFCAQRRPAVPPRPVITPPSATTAQHTKKKKDATPETHEFIKSHATSTPLRNNTDRLLICHSQLAPNATLPHLHCERSGSDEGLYAASGASPDESSLFEYSEMPAG